EGLLRRASQGCCRAAADGIAELRMVQVGRAAGVRAMMRMQLEKRLRALERRITVKPLPPFVVSCQADDGSTELCWIGWFDKGAPQSWCRNDGEDLPEALK